MVADKVVFDTFLHLKRLLYPTFLYVRLGPAVIAMVLRGTYALTAVRKDILGEMGVHSVDAKFVIAVDKSFILVS